MKRLFAALLAGGAVFSIAFASAAALTVNGGAIQAGEDLDVTCDDAVAVTSWGLDPATGSVNSVTIDDISPNCVAAEIHVRITSGGFPVATGSLNPIGGTSVTVPFAPAVQAVAITDIHIFIEGPAL